MYAPALIVDVTWWVNRSADKDGANIPADRVRIDLRPSLRGCVLALYSMLRRHVDLDDPSKSYGEIVVRPGVGIPVQLGRPLNSVSAELEVESGRQFPTLRAVVLILDKAAYDAQLGVMRTAITRLQGLTEQSGGRVLLLPVTTYDGWDAYFTDAAPVRLSHVPPGRCVEQCVSGVGANLATWLMSVRGVASPRVRIFVSHAKLDLNSTDSAATRLNQHIQQDSQIKTFFDASDIQRGRPITDQLRAGQRDAVLLSLRTDNYADSAWCHEEVLTAKALQMPVVSVWSVRHEERRALPYGGNVPTLVWDDARLHNITNRCLQAWLHHLHFQVQAPTALALAQIKLPRAFISRPPELVDFALGGLPVDRDAVVLYPDPPMPSVEARLLRLAHPRVRLATPTTLFGGAVLSVDPAPPLTGCTIALSLSDSPVACAPDVGCNAAGFNALHIQDAIAHLTLCIVRAGARLAYGGHLLPGGFTPFLASIIATHNSIGATKVDVPLVYLASYLRAAESDIKVERVDVGDEDITIDSTTDVTRRVGEALQLRAMRIRMAQDCHARVAIGGKDKGYTGRFPGVAEECLRMLETGRPIYPIGGFGGAAELVTSALLGLSDERLSDERMRSQDPGFDAFCDAYDRDARRLTSRGQPDPSRDPARLDEMAVRLAEFGVLLRGDQLDAQWTNGLTVRENRRLFCSRDLTEVAHLLMKGLVLAVPRASPDGVPANDLAVRVFHGSITDVEAAEAYAVPVVSGLAPTGSARALDERLAGRIRDRLRRPIVDLEVFDTGGARLAGRSVILVPLAQAGNGDLTVFEAPRECVARACEKLAHFVKTHKIASLTTVPFGVNLGLAPNASVEALLSAIRGELRRTAMTVTLCEVSAERYETIKLGLNRDYTELPALPVTSESNGIGRTPIVVSVTRHGDDLTISVLPPTDDTAAIVPYDPRKLTAADRGRVDVYATASRSPSFDRLKALGLDITSRLFAPSQIAVLAAHADRPIDVVHDVDSAAVPWELLALEKAGEVVFPACLEGMRRRLAVQAPSLQSQLRPRRLELGEQLRVLLVSNSDDLPHASMETSWLQAALAQQDRKIHLHTIEGSRATVSSVLDALGEQWDVFHYVGHAAFDSTTREGGMRLVDGWLTQRHIATAAPDTLRIPVLVVLNACQSARVRSEPESPQEPVAPSLAESILVGGARTFVGTFWEVLDASAATFARVFYSRLLSGETVGTAVVAARRALADEHAGDWVNYNVYGDTELRW